MAVFQGNIGTLMLVCQSQVALLLSLSILFLKFVPAEIVPISTDSNVLHAVEVRYLTVSIPSVPVLLTQLGMAQIVLIYAQLPSLPAMGNVFAQLGQYSVIRHACLHLLVLRV